METNIIHNMDCLDGMRELPDNCVDLVIADPPYYRIKSEDWDRQWGTFDLYLDWIEEVSLEIKRVMKDSGSFYIFGNNHRIAYIQVRLDKHFTFLNHLVWYKTNNMVVKSIMNGRRYVSMSERILFYAKQDQTGLGMIHNSKNSFKKIKEYMRGERKKIMEERSFRTIEEFNIYIRAVTGTSSVVDRHYFSDSQYVFPTLEIYGKLRKTGFFVRNYEDLRMDYEDLRRPFNPSPKLHEIITEPIITLKENTSHPTTKPRRLIRKLMKASSNRGDLILDPFMGSGAVAIVALRHDRKFIGYEISKEYCDIAEKRIEGWRNQTRLSSFFP